MRRFPALLALVALLAFPWVAQAEDYYLSHVANGNYGSGSFRMTFLMFNTNNSAVTARLKLTTSLGGPLTLTIPGLGTSDEFNIQLPAGATRIYQTDGSGNLAVGAAQVDSSARIGVSAIFSIYDAVGAFQTEAGVGSSDTMTDFVIPVDTTGSANTGIALFNPGTTAAAIALQLLDTSGQQVRQTTRNLAGKNHMAIFVSGAGQLFPDVSNFRGTLRITSPVSIAAIGLLENRTSRGPSYTSIPAVPRSSSRTTFRLAQVANGSFTGGSFRTSFLIFNISAAAATATLSLTGDNGSPFQVTIPGRGTSSTFNLQLAPGASLFLQTDGTGGLVAGAATITSNVPLGAAAIFTVLNSQGQMHTEAGVGDSPILTELTLPVDISGAFDTGIAFFAPTGAALSMKLLDSDGTIAGTVSRTLLPNNHLALFVTGLFPGTANFRGSLAVSAVGGAAALTLRQYQPANLPFYTTLPVAPGAAGGSQPASPALLSRTRAGVNVPGDLVMNETLPAGFRLTGTVAWPAAGAQGKGAQAVVPVGGIATIYARSGDASYYGFSRPLDNRYEIILPAGTYNLFADYPLSGTTGGSVSTTYADPAPIQVTGDTQRNITLPPVGVFAVTGTVSGLSNVPTGALVNIDFYSTDEMTSGSFSVGSTGSYSGKLPNGSYVAGINVIAIGQTLSGNNYLDVYNVGGLTVNNSPATGNFAIPSTAHLTGKVTVPGLATLPDGSMVSAYDATGGGTSGLAVGGVGFPAPGGAYDLLLAANRTYLASARVPVVQGMESVGSATYPWSGRMVNVGSGGTADIVFPAFPGLVRLSGKVTDGSGQPVADVSVFANSVSITGANDMSYSGGGETDANGIYQLVLFPGVNYQVSFSPPLPASSVYSSPGAESPFTLSAAPATRRFLRQFR